MKESRISISFIDRFTHAYMFGIVSNFTSDLFQKLTELKKKKKESKTKME